MNWGYLPGVGKVPGQATGAVRGVRKNGQLAPWRSCRVPPTLIKPQVRALWSSIGASLVDGNAGRRWSMGTPHDAPLLIGLGVAVLTCAHGDLRRGP